jgi:hypothetical protein
VFGVVFFSAKTIIEIESTIKFNEKLNEERFVRGKIEAELKAVKNHLKFANNEEYITVRSKKDKEENNKDKKEIK